MTRTPRKYRTALLAAAATSLALGTTTALAGSGVGGVFNLGQTNSVDAQSTLVGNPGSNPLLRVTGSGTAATLRADAATGTAINGMSASGIGQAGESTSSHGVQGVHSGTSGGASGVFGKTNSINPGSAGVTGQNTGGGPGLQAIVTSNSVAPLRVNSTAKVMNLNADKLDGIDSSELVRAGLGSGGSLTTGFAFVEQTSVTLTAPAAGFVLLVGTISVNSLLGGDTSCNPCRARIQLRNKSTADTSKLEIATFGNGASEQGTELTQTWVFPVQAGSVSFALDANVTGNTGTIFFDNPTLTALYVPFGSSGGGTLGATSTPRGRARSG
jgi:hypothetical protein